MNNRPYRSRHTHKFIQMFLRVAEVLVHSNLVIALAAVGVGITTMRLAGFPIDHTPLLFVFVATWFTYTINRFTDATEDAYNLPARSQFINRYGHFLLGVTGIAYVALLLVTALRARLLLPFMAIPLVGILVYARYPIKRIFLVKNGAVGAVWALIPIALGFYVNAPLDPITLIVAGVIFCHISLAAAIFDIKDISGDRAVGSLTLPVLVGKRRTRNIVRIGGVILLFGVGTISIIFDQTFAVLGLYPLHILLVSSFATTNRGAIFYGLVIDGEHLLIAAITCAIFVNV